MLLKQLEELKILALREHYYCEDGWYSCPLSIDGCANFLLNSSKCNCGADEHNEKVEQLFLEIKNRLTKAEELGYIRSYE